MAAKYKDDAERWKRRLDECESANDRLRRQLTALHQQVYSLSSSMTPPDDHTAAD